MFLAKSITKKTGSSRYDFCATHPNPAWWQRDAGTVTLRTMFFIFVFLVLSFFLLTLLLSQFLHHSLLHAASLVAAAFLLGRHVRCSKAITLSV